MNITSDMYIGCLLGGAAGDALGAPAEFMSLSGIRNQFGNRGIREYVEYPDRKGRFTDDTQMTLFTVEGLLRALHREMSKGISGALIPITYQSYLRWLFTQGLKPRTIPDGYGVYDVEAGWLVKQKGLYKRRAPGNTCLRALQSGKCGTIDQPINTSKGCGGIMRIAPVGLVFHNDPESAFSIGCDIAAITHSHPAGYLASGCLAAIIAFLVSRNSLESAIRESTRLLKKEKQHRECLAAIEKAIAFSRADEASTGHIRELGEGWVAEEALSISLYCALRFQDNFSEGVIASINHNGDSDSTGSITGNILGLINGKHAIPAEWTDNLIMADIVEQAALDIYAATGGNVPPDDAWALRYPPY